MRGGQAVRYHPGRLGNQHVSRASKRASSRRDRGRPLTNPFDAGLGWVVDMDKGDFIGRRTLLRDRSWSNERQQVVGLLPEEAVSSPPTAVP